MQPNFEGHCLSIPPPWLWDYLKDFLGRNQILGALPLNAPSVAMGLNQRIKCLNKIHTLLLTNT